MALIPLIFPFISPANTVGVSFYNFLEEFSVAITPSLIDCPKHPNGKMLNVPDLQCGNCCLKFFYCYDGAGWHHAIWVKVYNLNGVNIWIRIQTNDPPNGIPNTRRSINVWRRNQLNCMNLNPPDHFGLPDLTLIPPNFDNIPPWRTDNQVADIPYNAIINQMCHLLDACLCNAHAI